MSLKTWCNTCVNSTAEIPSELKPVAAELKKFYPEIVYCKVKKAVLVANPSTPAQIVDMSKECDQYKQA